MAWPSKSGMDKAIEGTPATSFWLMGMTPLASMEVSARIGHALFEVRNSFELLGIDLPVYIGITRVEIQVELCFPVSVDPNVH